MSNEEVLRKVGAKKIVLRVETSWGHNEDRGIREFNTHITY